ncbi:hypothetical protein [Jannaschia rubra]|uniref:hypothetical protein n=1 Tax=Jannaschia rubra TaxID=282197 RepID=UPI002490E55C|nr:hypothetical protein [Jannaschia rubra]
MDIIRQVFPNSTMADWDPEDYKDLFDQEPDPNIAAWFAAPWFPTDLFAITAHLLQAAGALAFFDPDDGLAEPKNGPPRFLLSENDRQHAINLGRSWERDARDIATSDTPAGVQKLWEALLKERDELMSFNGRDDEVPKWWTTALQLLIAADEASAAIGMPAQADEPVYVAAIRQEVLPRQRDDELTESDVSLAKVRIRGSRPSFAIVADPSIVCVFPKCRTSVVGNSLRNYSRNLTLLPAAGHLRCQWQMPAGPFRDDNDEPIDILLIPYPYEVAARAFEPTHTAKDRMRRDDSPEAKSGPGWGNFQIRQTWLEECDVVDLAVSLLKAAQSDVRSVNGVVLPEYALDYDTFTRLCRAIEEQEENIEFVIAGSSTNCNEPEDGKANYVMTCVWHRLTDTEVSGVMKTRTGHMVTSRRKHHRWRLDSTQLESYALTSALDPRIDWWEQHTIGRRELHFHPFRRNSIFTAMICEDLARSDPCHEVLRNVGPNLVFVLLMDGPQIASRWSARYASTLSDDPGCSVLTLSSRALVERSNQTHAHARQNAIAYYTSPFGQTAIHMDPSKGEGGVLLTLTSQGENGRQTIDGRPLAGSQAWRLTSTQPVKATEPSTVKDRYFP